jgi:hypothetical protein
MENKELAINVKLENKEVDDFEFAKEKTGIRTNAEFVRFLITQYAKEIK